MGKIESVKTYVGKDLETIFFRPMLSGKNAEELGIRVLYNMPVPTTLHFWSHSGNILQKYSAAGWNGKGPSEKLQKTIDMQKVKAEVGYSAEDYFSMVFEHITNRADVNLEDLSGTELEEAETRLFKEAVAESLRATMWVGDMSKASGFNTFDGFLPKIFAEKDKVGSKICFSKYNMVDRYDVHDEMGSLLDKASPELKALKAQGCLAFFVTTDMYNAYERHVADQMGDASFAVKQNGAETLTYLGIPVIDMQIDGYLADRPDLPGSLIMLTDRRNLALAVNTSDYPGTEVRMWYNPDLMENRQRAVFMAGADYLLPELIVVGWSDK